jgi:hypothetical protein
VAKSLSVNVTGSQALFEDFEDDTLVYSFTLSPSSEFGAYDDTFAPAGLRSFRTLNVSYYAGQEWYAGTTVNLSNPGQVTFLYNVNGTTCDSLRFYIDGVLQFTVKGSSTTTATRFTAPLTAASHLLEWRYIWNSSYSNSAMGCRLDNLLVSQAIPNASPTAAFSLSDSTYISGEYLNVIQESSDPDDATLDYAWAVWNKSLYQSPTWVNAGTDPSGPDPASYLQPASYSLQLTVYDALRASNSTTRDFTVTADTKPPAMAITSPANGTQATGTVNVSATASDPNGIKQVDFKIDGVLQATASVPAYSFAWDTTTVPEGSHTITVDAYDTKDNKATQTVTVLVDRTSPQLVLTSPGDQAYVRGLVTVTATASDANGVTRVEFYYDGVLSQTVAAAPYTATWDTSVLTGAHTLAAKAYDLAGNVTATAARTVYVDNTPPTVGLTTPANLGAVSGPTTLTATATDDVSGVTQVEFFVDGWSVGVATSSPYSSTYDFDQLTPGAFQVKAVATDRSGNTAETTVMVTHHAIYEDFEDTTYQIAWAYNSWVRSTVTPYAGVGCFKSGTTAASTSTYVRTPSYSFPNGGKVTFRYRVSSRAGDVFSFRWGTTTKLSFGGIQDWTFYAIDVPAGTTTDLRFFYTKDASGVSGEDAAYIDDLVIQINP